MTSILNAVPSCKNTCQIVNCDMTNDMDDRTLISQEKVIQPFWTKRAGCNFKVRGGSVFSPQKDRSAKIIQASVKIQKDRSATII